MQNQYHHKTYQGQKARRTKKFLKFFVFSIVFFVLLITLLGLGVFIFYAKDLPRPEVFGEREQVLPTKIYDRTGTVLLRTIYGEEKREIVNIDDLPKNLIDAILATEDAHFYEHHGVDLQAIGRAILIDLRLKQPVQGASTISQQLIRSTFLTSEKSAKRKVREVVLTLELERRYSKKQILNWYLNQVSFGPNIYGVGEASETFFNKPASQVDLAQSAILASLIKAPSFYYPYGPNLQRLLERKDYVLDRMAKESFVSQKEAEEAKKEKINFKERALSLTVAPHFTIYVENYLYQKYGADFLKEHGLKVYTTLDVGLQKKAEEIVKKGAENNARYGSHNASLVAITPKNGQIVAMVGSKDYFGKRYPKNCIAGKNCKFEPKVNIAIYGQGQQPGSSFKPFVYATAFKKGYTPDSIVVDERTNFGKWGSKDYIPENYDHRYRGPVTFRQALAQSLNIPAIKVLLMAGIKDSLQTAKDMGITTLNKAPSFYGPSLVLGAGEVKLLDMVSAYGVFATNGLRMPPTAILRIEDQDGTILEKNDKSPKRVLSEDVCQKITSILSDNNARAPMFGRHSLLFFNNYKVAAKTGTTDGFRDAWAIGYTPSISVGVWTGNNDNSSTAKKPGLVMAGPIWHQFMNVFLTENSN